MSLLDVFDDNHGTYRPETGVAIYCDCGNCEAHK